MVQKIRKTFLMIWIFLVISFGIYVLFNRELLDPEYLLGVFRSFGGWAIALYIFISLFRSIILLPSLPLIIVGMLYAPDMPNIVYLVSMLGVWFSGTLVYYFSHIIGLDSIFHHHVHDPKIKKSIDRYGAYVISFWSFFPIFPIDVACYLAGTVHMKFWKFFIALTIGEGLMIGIIIYGGNSLVNIFL